MPRLLPLLPAVLLLAACADTQPLVPSDSGASLDPDAARPAIEVDATNQPVVTVPVPAPPDTVPARPGTIQVPPVEDGPGGQASGAPAAPVPPPGPVLALGSGTHTGAEVLARDGFTALRGRRIGLIANHTSTVANVHLADWLHRRTDLTLVALFGPEHGIRGDADAGARVVDGRDASTGLPVYSLYGANRAPTDAMLEGIDALVFDVQDVGSRFYTFISTMGLSMQAAARKGIPFYVLDRPNPLGGAYVGGFTLVPAQRSFVGQFEIPQAHGLTVGELAQVLKGQRLQPGLENLDLRVVRMENWQRTQRWPATGLAWVAPSPNIPTFEAALVYAGTCLVEGVAASEGRGTRRPFQRLGAPFANADRLAATLNARRLPGVRFTPARFTPVSIAGMSAEPKFKDVPVQGVDIEVTDAQAVQPVELGVHVVHAFLQQAPDKAAFFGTRAAFFDKLTGSPQTREMLLAGRTPEQIIAAYAAEVARFRTARAPYLLY